MRHATITHGVSTPRSKIDAAKENTASTAYGCTHRASQARTTHLERFRAKWIPVRVKKTRQNKKIERGCDSIQSERALN
jgi:hypothetical protein